MRKPWKKLRAAVNDLGEDPPDEELHAVRIRAKRCRYAAEAVAPAVGKPAKQFAAAVEQVQEVLGEHQDAVVAGQWLRTHAADGGGRVERAFVAGELAARRGRRRRRLARRVAGDLEAGQAALVASMDVSRTSTVRAAGGIVHRHSPGGTRGVARAPAPLRRLEPAEGQGRSR